MEFKDKLLRTVQRRRLVDIGTEWNLKFVDGKESEVAAYVDIGTEWNLKP